MDDKMGHEQCLAFGKSLRRMGEVLQTAGNSSETSAIVAEVLKILRGFKIIGRAYADQLVKKVQEVKALQMEKQMLESKVEQLGYMATVKGTVPVVQRASTSKNVTRVSPEMERGRLADLWKEAFPVGTGWDQYDKVYEINWDFSNLEVIFNGCHLSYQCMLAAFEECGLLFGKRVYLFGCTEPQLVLFKHKDGSDMSRVVHIPAVVAVTSAFPPSDKVGIKSVQMEGEMIVAMKEMKMGWIPYIPDDVTMHTSVERYKTQIFTLKCTQRRAALKQLRQERMKKYEYCLPCLDQPLKEEDVHEDTNVHIVYPVGDDTKPSMTKPSEKQGKARKRTVEEMSEQTKQALPNMHFYKFYPTNTDDTPDISDKKAAFINQYYGKATQVL